MRIFHLNISPAILISFTSKHGEQKTMVRNLVGWFPTASLWEVFPAYFRALTYLCHTKWLCICLVQCTAFINCINLFIITSRGAVPFIILGGKQHDASQIQGVSLKTVSKFSPHHSQFGVGNKTLNTAFLLWPFLSCSSFSFPKEIPFCT